MPGQEEKKVTKELSAKDKAVIIEIFKSVDSRLYRFAFSKEENFGTKNLGDVAMKLLRDGKKVILPNSIVEGLEGVFGKANAARLQAIINKYGGDGQ